MADFGQNRLWPKPTLAKTDFGQNQLWPKPTLTCCVWCVVCGVLVCVLCVWCVCVWCVCGAVVCVWCVVSRVSWSGVGVGFTGLWFGHVRCPLTAPSHGPPFPRTAVPTDRPSPGPPFPRTALPLDRPSPAPPFPGPPKISLFFPLSRLKIRSFLFFLGVFSWNFGGVFEGREAHMCTFGPLVVV